MKFRSGKYIGLTVEHVKTIAPWYVKWVSENRPEMLKEHSFKSVTTKITTRSTRYNPYEGIKPNYDLDTTEYKK